MNPRALRSLPSQLFASAMLAVSALLLASCGGGGAAAPTTPAPGTALSVLPGTANFYAGIPYTITVAGGRRPYILSSSEATLLAVPSTLSGDTFQVLPNNPGVVDAGLDPNEVPRRAVTVTVRDQDGAQITASYSVLQNFLTGYGVTFVSNCAAGAAGAAPQACAGGETTVFIRPVTNGLLYGNRLVRFEIIRGDFQFIQANGTVANTFTTNTDHTGLAIARLRVSGTASGQLATLRIIDVATGVYADQVFQISPTAATGIVTIVPSTVTFTGVNNTRCGTGSADILVFGGTAPYTATSTNGAVAVSPTTSTSSPGRFTVTALNQSICGTFTVVVTDATGSRAEVQVTTQLGTATVPPVTVAPSTLNIAACGASGSVSVIGGSGGGNLVANSSSPRIAASLSGNTLTVTRLRGDVPVAVDNLAPQAFTVNVTDGATSSTLTVNAPTACAP